MSFEALTQSADRLRTTLQASTGRPLVAQLSLEGPRDDRGEAAFIKAVLWGYVLWFEACQPVGRHLMNIVRNSEPNDYRTASRIFQEIQNLRTFQAHNLLPSSKGDQYKLNQAKAWLIQNGGAERDWDRCTKKLCLSLADALEILCSHWSRVISLPDDADTAIQSLIQALDREWAPHLFDHLIQEVATSLGLADFDAVKYRETRLEEWRKIAEFFLDSSSAEIAVRRVIHQEMTLKFGKNPILTNPEVS